MEIVNHRIAKKFYMHAWKCKFKFNSKNKQSLKVILFVPVLVEIKTIVLKTNTWTHQDLYLYSSNWLSTFSGKEQGEEDYSWKERRGKDQKETYNHWNTGNG